MRYLFNFGLISALLMNTFIGGCEQRVESSEICPFQGLEVVIQAKAVGRETEISSSVLEEIRQIIENRAWELDINQISVYSVAPDQINVQLAGADHSQSIIQALSASATLEFREEKSNIDRVTAELKVKAQEKLALQLELATLESQPTQKKEAIALIQQQLTAKDEQINALQNEQYQTTELTGAFLRDVFPNPNSQTQNWSVALNFNDAGSQLFAEITQKIAGTGRSIGIFLDDKLISAPIISKQFEKTGITGGHAVIEGNFTAESANTLALQLRSAALPAPLELLKTEAVNTKSCEDTDS